MKLNQTLLFFAASLTFACAEDVDSDDVRTGGLYPIFEAVADGSGDTQIDAQLRVGGDGGTYAELSGDDVLTAITDDDEDTLNHKNNGNRHYYTGSIEGDEEGLTIQIAFTRGEQDDDATESYASLPAPFVAGLEDESESEIARGDDVFVVWDNQASGKMEWSIEGDCIKSESGSTNDDGSLTIDSDDIEVWETDKGESCEVTITLDRIEDGETDAAFDSGEYRAIQRREVTFTSTPGDDETDE